MMNKFALIFFFAGFFFSSTAQQIRQFSPDTIQYAEEVRKFTNNYVSAEESKIIEKFISLWLKGLFTREEMISLADNSTKLLRKNGRPSPHFTRYFEILLILYSPEYKDVGKTSWLKTFNFFLSDNDITIRTVEQYLKVSLELLKNNELYNLPGNIWKGINPSFHFEFSDEEPWIVFESFDLICYSKRDSILIKETSGKLDPISNIWYGRNGLVTWERAGLSKNEVFVQLAEYQIDLRKSEYTADSVRFFYKKYLDYPMDGKFEDKVTFITDPEKAMYPRFFSYQNKFFIPDVFPDIEYVGALSMQGNRLIGNGSTEEPALLNIYEKDVLRIKIESDQFVILEDAVNSPGAGMTLYIESDSVFHPNLQFNYNEKNNDLRFMKSRTYTSAGPYTNSYHKVDMNFDEFHWKRDERIVRFKPFMGTAFGTASFESDNFFNYTLFEDLQGRDHINPLVALWQFSRIVNNQLFPAAEYARYLGMPVHQVRQELMKLSRLGLIFFDDEADIIEIRPKLLYFLDASVGKTDYDVIRILSKTQAPAENAFLDLDNCDLTIKGIQHIFLSDSQNVVLLPSMNQIVMKKNKSFQFNGTVHAGLFSFYGNNFYFDYDHFKINMQDIDSVNFAVLTGEVDNLGRLITEKVKNNIEDARGELRIDETENKSGLKNYPHFPIFNSHDYAYVYFDEPIIQNGVYPRSDVYFKIDPFTKDSLDNFTQEGMKLSGEFISQGILSVIDQTLILMPDNSLGFNYMTPENGIPVYNGKGTFYQGIELSNKGLIGSGKLEYLTSTTFSDEFLLHPDSLMTLSREFTIDKQYTGTEYPDVSSKNNEITWYTGTNQFHAKTTDIPFTIFADTISQTGELTLTPDGLSGEGTLDMVSASITSGNLVLLADQILADSADLKLRSPEINKLALITENVKSHIDFVNLKGEFFSNEGYTLVSFPENRFISKLDFFIWFMKEKQLHMGLNTPVTASVSDDGLEGPRYISVHPAQDSLSFVSPLAQYDFHNFIITATNVPYIQVADARIYPEEGTVIIDPNAELRKLENARIITDITNQFYKLYDATVEIKGKYNYNASAKYNYIDETKRSQIIVFDQIKTGKDRRTTGQGSLSVTDSFKINPYFNFQGNVHFTSGSHLLTFDGAAQLVSDCVPGDYWLKFKSEIDPLDVRIPVPEAPVDINLNRLYAGIMLSRDSANVYSTFLTGRRDYFDSYITNASGYLIYNRENEYYQIAQQEKLRDSTRSGDYLRLISYPCITYSEGKVNYQVNYGQLKTNAFGRAFHNMENNEFESDVLITFDFLFSQDALNILASEIEKAPGLRAYDVTQPVFNIGLREMTGTETARKMSAELSLYGNYRTIPPEFRKTLILSNVRLKWNPVTRSFRYHGDAGIIRVGEKQINKQAEIYIELSKRASGDLLDIYLVVNEKTWYYFGYNPGSLQVVSSNRSFNDLVMNLKENQRKIAVKGGEQSYIYTLAPERRAQLFLRRYLDEAEN